MLSLREYREPTQPPTRPAALGVPRGARRRSAKGRRLSTTVAFRGPDLASSLDSELIAASARLNNALRRLGSGWGLFVEAQRFRVERLPAIDWSHPAAGWSIANGKTAFEKRGLTTSRATT
jgi:hypothetical protein